MIVAFFESIKYVGHLFPVSILRIYLGFVYLSQAMERYQGDFLIKPRLAGMIGQTLPTSSAPDWYRTFIEQIVIPHWLIFAYAIAVCEIFVGMSYLLGYMVRPFAMIAALLCLSFVWVGGLENQSVNYYQLNLVVHLTLAVLGAGRCLGIDYFFFKRHRGIWW